MFLLLFLVGCDPTSNVGDSTPQAPTGESPTPVNSSDNETGAEAVAASEPTAEASGPGLAIGTKAPDFTLKNQAGEDISLSSLLEEQNVALVFYRSADW